MLGFPTPNAHEDGQGERTAMQLSLYQNWLGRRLSLSA